MSRSRAQNAALRRTSRSGLSLAWVDSLTALTASDLAVARVTLVNVGTTRTPVQGPGYAVGALFYADRPEVVLSRPAGDPDLPDLVEDLDPGQSRNLPLLTVLDPAALVAGQDQDLLWRASYLGWSSAPRPIRLIE